MHKSILVFIYLFSSSLSVIYKPMTKRSKDFGEDVCRFTDISGSENIVYVKPCREGKRCESLGTSQYSIYSCIDGGSEYSNLDQPCVTKNNGDSNGIDCTDLSCVNDICGGTVTVAGQCQENQVRKTDDNTCVNDPGICLDNSDTSNPISYTPGVNKRCVQFELQTTDNGKTYIDKKIYSNYIASIDDGEFIKDDRSSNIRYCKSGYALYFYGNKQLNNPNIDNLSSHKMYLRCVSILGRDMNGIIKYKIGNDEEKYYNPHQLPINPSTSQSYELNLYDKYLMTRIEIFNNYKKRVDQLNCRATGCEDDDEIIKWLYFYTNPQEYLLYKNEPQIIEYLIKETIPKYNYKVYHTSSTESSSILNIKYLIAILSLLLLF